MPQPKLKVQLKLLSPHAKEPQYMSAGAAAFDLHACIEPERCIIIEPGKIGRIPTGLSIYLENPDYGLFIWERSGLGSKGIERRGGLVDSDYQGEIMVMLTNGTSEPFVVWHGDRVAQAVCAPIQRLEFVEVEYFSSTSERGTNGFGSTGV